MKVLEFMEKMDSRIIYALIFILVSWALLAPPGLPITMTDYTKTAFDLVEGLKAGDYMYFGCDYAAASLPEVEPVALAMFRQAMRKGVKLVAGGMHLESTGVIKRIIDKVGPEFPDKKYGVDYINLGYKPGGVVFLEKLLTDANAACAGVDAYGKPLSDFPIMQGFKTLKDAKLVVAFGSQTPGVYEYVKIVSVPHKIKVIGDAFSLHVPQLMPLVKAGDLAAIIQGLKGAAEYELLVNQPGPAMSGMDAQSMIHLLIVISIILGNIGYLSRKKTQGGAR